MTHSPILSTRIDEKLLKEIERAGKSIDRREIVENAFKIALYTKGKNAMEKLQKDREERIRTRDVLIEKARRECDSDIIMIDQAINEVDEELNKIRKREEEIDKEQKMIEEKNKRWLQCSSFLDTISNDLKVITTNNFKDPNFLQPLSDILSKKYSKYNDLHIGILHLSKWFSENNGHPVEVKA